MISFQRSSVLTGNAAEQEGGPGHTDAPAQDRPAADHVAPQHLLEELMLLGHGNLMRAAGSARARGIRGHHRMLAKHYEIELNKQLRTGERLAHASLTTGVPPVRRASLIG